MKAPIARMVVKAARGAGRKAKAVQVKPLPVRRAPPMRGGPGQGPSMYSNGPSQSPYSNGPSQPQYPQSQPQLPYSTGQPPAPSG